MVSMVSRHKERGFKSQLELIENVVQIATKVCGVMIIGSMKKDIWCNEAKEAVDEGKMHIRGRSLQKMRIIYRETNIYGSSKNIV